MSKATQPPDNASRKVSADEELSLAEIIRFFERSWLLIALSGLVAGLAAATFLLVQVSSTFTATATMVIVAPETTSDLRPRVLTVEGYHNLLESDAVLSETQRRLIDAGVLAEGEYLEIEGNIESRVSVSKTNEEGDMSPLLEAIGRAGEADKAAAIANTWAAVFVDSVAAVTASASRPRAAFYEEEYPKSLVLLTENEGARTVVANEIQQSYDEKATSWDEKGTALEKETTDLVAAYNGETRSLIEKHLRSQVDDVTGSGSVAGKLRQLTSVRAELAVTSPTVDLERAIGDDALWQSLVLEELDGKADARAVWERKLHTQESNPVYTQAMLRAVELETEINGLAGSDHAAISRFAAELDRLARERSGGLRALGDDRRLAAQSMDRKRQRDLEGVVRERDVRLGALDREIGQLRNRDRALSEKYNEAIVARAKEDVADAYLAAPAVPVQALQPSGIILKTILAAAIGALLGMVAAMIGDAQDASPEIEQA